MNVEVKKYWMVHGIGCGAPHYCHASKTSAQAEAARLAKMSPGTIFTVLAAVDAYQAPQVNVRQVSVVKRVETSTICLSDDDVPF